MRLHLAGKTWLLTTNSTAPGCRVVNIEWPEVIGLTMKLCAQASAGSAARWPQQMHAGWERRYRVFLAKDSDCFADRAA